jgi:hypothetical protein
MPIYHIFLELCQGQSSKCKNEKRAITLTISKTELLFFSTALFHNDIYLPTKLYVDIS